MASKVAGRARGLRYRSPASIGAHCRIRVVEGDLKLGRCQIGSSVNIAVVGKSGSPARLQIGDGSLVGDRCIINSAIEVTVGTGSRISWDCQILDTDFHKINYMDVPTREVALPVRIGDDVLVGTSSIILKGVSIGDGAIVAAGSVVTRDVNPGWLVAGNPARPVRRVKSWQL